MKKAIFALFFLCFYLSTLSEGLGEIISQLPTQEKAVALTFDACETITPSYFDRTIIDFLLQERIPATFFICGKFARRNQQEIKALAKIPFFEFENHSVNHRQHMERLSEKEMIQELDDSFLRGLTGKKTKYFRFPGGHCDARSLGIVERHTYKIVHWSFASGDADKRITPSMLSTWVLLKTRPGSIVIFHVNGRGYSTGVALPGIVYKIKQRGYRFVKLGDYCGPP
jgi:peptidoglycan/xylan/chitin deacetylase (PgdA/CDA1 family)